MTSQTIITLILRLRDSLGVTSLLATNRLQDAFGLANYRFDVQENRVVKLLSTPADAVHSGDGQAVTNIMVLRDGRVYFQGGQKDILESQDEYLERFLV